jgi:hypothetical protein
MVDTIISLLTTIDQVAVGLGAPGTVLQTSWGEYLPTMHNFVLNVMSKVAMPIASVILALFFVLEMYRASLRTENMGNHNNKLGAEIVVRILIRLVLFKTLLDNVPRILETIYQVTQEFGSVNPIV